MQYLKMSSDSHILSRIFVSLYGVTGPLLFSTLVVEKESLNSKTNVILGLAFQKAFCYYYVGS